MHIARVDSQWNSPESLYLYFSGTIFSSSGNDVLDARIGEWNYAFCILSKQLWLNEDVINELKIAIILFLKDTEWAWKSLRERTIIIMSSELMKAQIDRYRMRERASNTDYGK